ncbi:MAG TPA: 2-oxo-4-hydroxy-4-carboxy-5-ureidoimidazoline decarboxylase [Pyrinomonadaceae bacterium]|nr:2-oxo-4-hydroxy-4-carboxy-5-ureidoimidazoline decarboxylase [Pyrinomonadaceae bacterium]
MQANLKRLNLLPASEAEGELLKCCGSRYWARQVAAARPFTSVEELTGKAEQFWWDLQPDDWLEAFHSHPKIGEKKAAAKTALAAQKWSAQEQSGVESSDEQVLNALAKLNRAYEEKFGFIFIVCATGKTSAEMLQLLRERLENPREVELRNAAAEQAKITELRLRKLIETE